MRKKSGVLLLFALHLDDGLALHDIDDLVSLVDFLGARVAPRGDGHDGRLAALRFLEHAEEFPPVIGTFTISIARLCTASLKEARENKETGLRIVP